MIRLLSIVAWLVATTAFAAPAWRNIGLGGGGWIPTVAVSPHDSRVVYAGCDVGGFFKSTDAGATWHNCNTGLHDLYVEVIVPHPKDPKIIYIGTEGGVHKSTDGGETWQWLREGFPALEKSRFSAPIGALAIDPHNPDVVYAGIGRPRWNKDGKGTVYRTSDAGAHWRIVNPKGGGMEADANIASLIIHPQQSNRLYAATSRGLYRSDDSGVTWRKLEKGLPHSNVRRVALCENRPETMYLTLRSTPSETPWQGGVYRSDDGGETWSPRLKGLANRVGKPGAAGPMTSNVDRLVVHPENADIVYAGDNAWVTAGVYRTADGGQSWQHVSKRKEMDYGWITMWGPSVMGLAMDTRKPDTLYFSTSGHIFRTANAGEKWMQTYSKQQTDTNLWSGTGLETTCMNSIFVHPRDPQRLFFCYFDIGLLQSFDGGKTFRHTVSGMKNAGNTFTIAFDPENPQIVFAGTGWWEHNAGDVCRSDDGGLTWTIVGKPETGLPDGQTRHIIVDPSSPASARRIFVSVNEHGVYCSEDGGASWKARGSGLADGSIVGLTQHPQKAETLFALLADGKNSAGGLFRSNDRGEHWEKISTNLDCAAAQALAVSQSNPQRMYVAGRNRYANKKMSRGGVFASSDGGVTWSRVLENHFIKAVAVDPRDADTVYAGGTDHPYHDEALGLGVMRSRDGGKTWESLNAGGLSNPNVGCITVDPHKTSRIYVGTGGNGAFVREE